MYAGSVTAADREEYLLGKPIERSFLKQDDTPARAPPCVPIQHHLTAGCRAGRGGAGAHLCAVWQGDCGQGKRAEVVMQS